jgi:hypothetical protein
MLSDVRFWLWHEWNFVQLHSCSRRSSAEFARVWPSRSGAWRCRAGRSPGRTPAEPGAHRGELLAIPPTGKSVALQGICVDRLQDGNIVNRHEIVDALGLFQQLGVVPGQSG